MKNHLHKVNRGILALLIVTSMFYSCSEDDDVQNLEPEYSVKLKFENYDDYFEELHKVSNMGVEERIVYEKANGYRSKRSIQEEFYYSIDFEKFKSQDEIIQFVNNSEHLKIVYDENREMHIEIEDDYTFKSYLTDEKGVYQIDDLIFKINRENVYFTNEAYKNLILQDKIEQHISSTNNKIGTYKVIKNIEENIGELNRLQCSMNRTRANERATNNRDRAYAAIEIEEDQEERFGGYDHNGNPFYILEKWVLTPIAIARAYRRTAGIWFWAGTSELRLNVNFGIKYRNASTIPNFSQNLVGYHVKVINWTGNSTRIPAISSDNPYAPFGFLNNANTKVSKTGTGEATINCNSTWTFFND